ncbi:bromodomain adjacent to zinc finger domain protein 2B isoform X17 [Phyllostomus discolor]|uniref:Bromodomain adjacent to zinc finger domain protein 2B n=1 Tax=Phyllostomus discolor TaxID=89673 RepID=A0A7E6DJQ1_9CHIR|nr:bromodomain adjacent to zinc finger domain protein 2B isoform X17 [Phyllostomus discolor]
MESGERLPSSTASSTVPTSSSMPSVASSVSKGGLSTGAASLSSTINPCGHLFRAAGDQPFNLSTVSSAFPMVSHPVFGLHSASSGHSEFGGLGTLGTPTALAAHPQLASFPEWWRTTDVHTRTGATFFPPLLGIPPLFAPPTQNHDSSSFHSRTSGKSNRNGPEKGVNGSINGNSTSSVSGINTSVLSTAASSSVGQTKSISSGGGNRKCNQDQNKNQPLDARADKIKDKKPRKEAIESSSNSDSDSGTSSDTSSEGISSSDSDDLEEDEEEEDQSIEESEDDDSGSESEAQHESNNQVLLHGISDPKADGQKATEKAQEKRIHQPLPLVSESQTHSSFQSQQKQPQVLSQQLPFIFQSSQAKEESVNKHTSVIQSTGLVSNVKPLSLVNQAKKETYTKLIVPSPDVLKAGNKNTSEESSPLTSELRSKREQYKQTFPAQLKKQESSKSLKKVIAALSNPKGTSSSPAHPKPTLENNHPNPFLTNALLSNHQPNGVIQSVIQEAPLALTTKTKMQSKISENIATASSTPFSSPVNLSMGGRRTPGSQTAIMPSASPVLPSQGKEKAVSNNVNPVKTQHHSHPAKSLVEQFRGTDSDIPSSKDSEDSNEDEEEDDEEEDEDDEDDESDDSQSGTSKRRRVTDERELHIPLEYGWQRETRIRNFGGRLQGEVAYYAPCGKKLRQYPEVIKGMQWCLLKEEDVIPRIRAMEGRRGRPPNPDRQRVREESRARRRKGRPPNVGSAEFLENTDAKLLRKLQAQEIARQAAQIKLLRKLQKQEQARVAKEAKKQQAIMAAEEKRKQKEQIKIMKQQEKIKRIQQIRMEKELRAQQILEAKKKKKEEAANAKLLEAEKRIKEKEMRRQQAVLLKHQERERRRQHMMLMKAMEARKKAEEKERLKQEKRDEKRLNKERKLEQRRLELEMAKELKKPNEDMCLADQKPLPELPRIPGLVLSGSTFSDCLMVVQFLRNFGKVLGFDVNIDVPNLSVLQEGLLNIGDSMGEVQDLLVRLLSAAVCDPGLITGYKAKTALGEHLLNVGVNRDNVSEILQIFMEAHCGQTELTESLKTKAFQAHTPAQKASVLAFLINELACSKSVVSEIDKNIDYMSNLRRDKWVVEGKLRKLRIIHAKKTGKRDTAGGIDLGEEQHPLGTPTPGRKRRRKGGDSDYDDDDDDDSDDQADEDDEDEEDKEDKKGKKADICEDEDEGDQAASVEELEKQIEKLSKQQCQYRRKLFDASHSLRSMMFGQDRYRRRYWILPQCGGIFVEGMESGEGLEEIAKEREKLKKAESMQIKEERLEISEDTLNCSNPDHCEQKEEPKEKDNTNLFLQKPGSFSKLSKLLEVAKMPPESDIMASKPNSSGNGCTLSYQNSGKHSVGSIPSTATQSSVEKTDSNNLFNTGSGGPGKFYSPLPSDQLLKALTEKNRQWFSLLPRTPCDDTSLTHGDISTASLVTPPSQPPSKSPSPAPAPPLGSSSAQNPVGLNPFALSPLQMKSGVSVMGLQLCGWPTGVLTSNIPFTSPLPNLGAGLGLSEGNGNSFLIPNVASSKSESPVPQNEKVSSAQPAAVEVAKPVDFPSPKPIPEEMQFGWWRIIDPEDLKALLKVLHLRGIREKALQKQIQKHLDYITQACIRNKDVAIIELNENEENQVTRDIVENWSVEEQAMEMDLSILQQVEDLERRVASASLQVKGWMCPEPASEREDLVYFEHKSFSKLCKEHDGEFTGEEESSAHALERKSDNPLDIAVTRLADLERNIERRIEEDIAPGLRVWRRALSEARSAAQVALCIQQLQKSIAWEKSIMKVYCQICRKGDNEELLLLCDGCDKGCHTYCHRPKITTIPDGDWFCPACIAKASGQTLKFKKLHVKGKKNNDSKKGKKGTLIGDTEDEDSASTSSSLKRGSKDVKKRKMEENTSINLSKQESFASVKKPKRDDSKDSALCSMILTEMETHEDAWPFLLPVNLKLVPGYKKVIKKPMDFSTIREKLSSGQYPNPESFALDVRLVFDNCETFNEDDSDIGRAGHSMRKYFEKKWTDTFKVS